MTFGGVALANRIKLPEYAWYDPKEVEYQFPDSWQLSVYNIAGHERPALNPDEIGAAVASPIDSPPLRELAKGKKKVVILFDDLTRGTEVSKILPPVLEELAQAGIRDDQIEFICALGCHQAWDRMSLARKLGDDIIGRFPVYNHCPFLNCTDLGTTSYGTKVSVNSEVMSCDLKIGIGGVVPHASYGFGGGAKIIMPGVSSYDSVAQHHSVTHRVWRQRSKVNPQDYGIIDGNPMPLDAMEIARMAGLDFVIDAVMNPWGETVALFTGALESTFAAAVREARPHYRVDAPEDNDIVIANAYCKENEAYHAYNNGAFHVNRNGGDVVVLANTALGIIFHYLGSSHGRSIGGRNWAGGARIPAHVNHVIYYSEFPEARAADRFAEADRGKVLLMHNWTDVILKLKEFHGDSAKVAVFPSADIQISQFTG
jgi:nickel-dependent lactate racemase